MASEYQRYLNKYRPATGGTSGRYSTVSGGDFQRTLQKYAPDSDAFLDEGDGTPLWAKGVQSLFGALNAAAGGVYTAARQGAEALGIAEDDGRGWGETYGAALKGEGFGDLFGDMLDVDDDSHWFARFGVGALGFAADVVSDPLTYLTLGSSVLPKTAVATISRHAAKDVVKNLSEEAAEQMARRRIGSQLLIDGADEMPMDSLMNSVNERLKDIALETGQEVSDEVAQKMTINSVEEMRDRYAAQHIESVIGTARVAGGGRQVAQAIDAAVREVGGTTEMVIKGFGDFDKRLNKELLGGTRYMGRTIGDGAGVRALKHTPLQDTFNKMSNKANMARLRGRAKLAPTLSKFRGTWGDQYAEALEGISSGIGKEFDAAKVAGDLADADWIRSMRVLDDAAGDRAAYVQTMKELLDNPMKELNAARTQALEAGIDNNTIKMAMTAVGKMDSEDVASAGLGQLAVKTMLDAGVKLSENQRVVLEKVSKSFRDYKERLPAVLESAGIEDASLAFENRVLSPQAIAWKRGQGERFGQSSALKKREHFKKEVPESAASDLDEVVESDIAGLLGESVDGKKTVDMSVAEANEAMRNAYDIDFDFFVTDAQEALDAVFGRVVSTVGHRKSFERLLQEGVLIATPETSKKITDATREKLIDLIDEMFLSGDLSAAPPKQILEVLMMAADDEWADTVRRELAAVDTSYRGSYTAPTREPGLKTSMDDMSDIWPSDIYGPDARRLYDGNFMSPNDGDWLEFQSAILRARGNPGQEMTVYRAIPTSASDRDIHAGDWVALSRWQAEGHGLDYLDGDYLIVEKTVRADELFTNGNNFTEWGYDPLASKTPTAKAFDYDGLSAEFRKGFEADIDRISMLLSGTTTETGDLYKTLMEVLGDTSEAALEQARKAAELTKGPGRYMDELAFDNPELDGAFNFIEPDDFMDALKLEESARREAAYQLMGNLVRNTLEMLDETSVTIRQGGALKELLGDGVDELVIDIADGEGLRRVGEALSEKLKGGESPVVKELLEQVKRARNTSDLARVREQLEMVTRRQGIIDDTDALGLNPVEGPTPFDVYLRDSKGERVGGSGATERMVRRSQRGKVSLKEATDYEARREVFVVQEAIDELAKIFSRRERLMGLAVRENKLPIEFTELEDVALPSYLRGHERALWFGAEGITTGIKNLYRARGEAGQSALANYSDSLLTIFKTYATVGAGPGFHLRNLMGAVSNNVAGGVYPSRARDGQRLGSVAKVALESVQNDSVGKGVRTVGEFRSRVVAEANDSFKEKYGDEAYAKFFKSYQMSPGEAVMSAHDTNVLQGRVRDAIEDRASRAMAISPNGEIDYDKIIVKDYERRYLENPSQENLKLWQRKAEVKDGKYINVTNSERMKQKAAYSKIVNNTAINMSASFGEKVEWGVRLGAFLEGHKRFGGVDGGAMLARSLHFDYQDLSDFERKVMKRVLPFYTWTRNNLPLQARLFLNRPAGFAHLAEVQQAMMFAFANPMIDGEALPEWARGKMGFYGAMGNQDGNFLMRLESPKLDLFAWVNGEDPLGGLKDTVEGANPLLKFVADTSGALGGPTFGLSYAKPISEGGSALPSERSLLNLTGMRSTAIKLGALAEVFTGTAEEDDVAQALAFGGAPISWAKNTSINGELYNLEVQRRDLVRQKMAEELGVEPESLDARTQRLYAYRTGRYVRKPEGTSDDLRPEDLTDKEWEREKGRLDRLRRFGFID